MKLLYSELVEKFAHLIMTKGQKMSNIDYSLDTFEYCADYGIELDDSTIDKISLENGEIYFYYNVNENDYDTLHGFSEEDLTQFYYRLVEILATDVCSNLREGVFKLTFTEYTLCDRLREIANEIENSDNPNLLKGKDWSIRY